MTFYFPEGMETRGLSQNAHRLSIYSNNTPFIPTLDIIDIILKMMYYNEDGSLNRPVLLSDLVVDEDSMRDRIQCDIRERYEHTCVFLDANLGQRMICMTCQDLTADNACFETCDCGAPEWAPWAEEECSICAEIHYELRQLQVELEGEYTQYGREIARTFTPDIDTERSLLHKRLRGRLLREFLYAQSDECPPPLIPLIVEPMSETKEEEEEDPSDGSNMPKTESMVSPSFPWFDFSLFGGSNHLSMSQSTKPDRTNLMPKYERFASEWDIECGWKMPTYSLNICEIV